MIVKCEQCQTRFKIPDDKVTEKGVKVRCTKCQHTFRVKKEGDSTAPAGAPHDPFAKFGPPGGPPPDEQTRPGVFALGVQATKSGDGTPLAPSFESQANLPREAFDSPTRVGVAPAPPPGRRPLSDPAPFDFSSLSAPGPAPGQSDVTQRAAVPGPPKSSFEPQPFDFSALSAPPEPPKADVTRRERAPQKPSTFEPQPFDFSSLGGEQEPQTPAQREPVKPPAAPPPSTLEPQPFDFSGVEGGGLAPPPLARPPPTDLAKTRPSGPGFKPPLAAHKVQAPVQPEPAFELPSSIDFQEAPTKQVAPRASPAAVTQVDTRSVPEPPAPSSSGGLLGDIPADPGALSIDMDDGLEASHESRGALFDMPPEPEPSENQLQPAPPQEQVAVAKIALKKVSADQLAREKDEGQVASSRRPKRSIVAMVWNVMSFFVLLALLGVLVTVVLNEGKVDAALSWSKVKQLFSKPRELVAFDISNGLYDTRAGRPVFYVRGEVKNRGARAGRVKVKAEILDGEDLVRAAEGWVGATPSPEDLWAVATAEDLSRLSAKLAASAVQLQPGAESSFLVAFYEYPPDLKDFRVRVTVTPDDGTTAAR